MGRHTKEWNEGYQAAIEAIKKALEGGGSGDDMNGDSGDSGLPSDMTPPPSGGGQSGSGSNKQGKQNKQDNSGNSSNSRTSATDPNQGVVRPEDCSCNNSGVEGMPDTAGGFFSKDDGDKIAQAEGYGKEGGSESAVEQDWKETALKAANQISKPGDVWGKLKSTIEGLYKVQTDWKKALKYVVGRSINDSEKRQAYANKNILVSQDRIARTDKDKFDNMDYLLAVIDTSGSVDDHKLKILLTEVYGIALAKKPLNIVVMQCDTKVQDIAIYKNLRDFKEHIKFTTAKGRGGTDMGDVWRVLRTDKRFTRTKPDLTIIFTDSDSNNRQYPRDKKHMNHLAWCILDSPGFTLKYPDSMTKIIHLNSEDIL